MQYRKPKRKALCARLDIDRKSDTNKKHKQIQPQIRCRRRAAAALHPITFYYDYVLCVRVLPTAPASDPEENVVVVKNDI